MAEQGGGGGNAMGMGMGAGFGMMLPGMVSQAMQGATGVPAAAAPAAGAPAAATQGAGTMGQRTGTGAAITAGTSFLHNVLGFLPNDPTQTTPPPRT